jgi:hypothetical protein
MPSRLSHANVYGVGDDRCMCVNAFQPIIAARARASRLEQGTRMYVHKPQRIRVYKQWSWSMLNFGLRVAHGAE